MLRALFLLFFFSLSLSLSLTHTNNTILFVLSPLSFPLHSTYLSLLHILCRLHFHPGKATCDTRSLFVYARVVTSIVQPRPLFSFVRCLRHQRVTLALSIQKQWNKCNLRRWSHGTELLAQSVIRNEKCRQYLSKDRLC